MERFGVLDVKEHECVIGSQIGGQDPTEGKEEILSSQWLTIRPTNIFAQFENPLIGAGLIYWIPFFSNTRQSHTILGRVLDNQAFKK